MKKNILCVLVCVLLSTISVVAQSISFRGKVIDEQTLKPINGANLVILKTSLGTSTNSDGSFIFSSVKESLYSVEISCIGYETTIVAVNIKAGMHAFSIGLVQKNVNLNEVAISRDILHRTENSLKISAPLKDLPISTVSVESELIQQKQITSINEALKNATGITPVLNYGGFQTFTMRGFGSPVIMLDGARDERMNFSASAPVTSLASVERVEYLKGPASVLYGHSAVGGIVNIVQKKPSDVFKANFSATYGSWETKNIFLGAGDKLTDKLSYRFDIGLSDREGWRDNGDKMANAYLALDYKISDADKLEVRFNANNDFYGTETGLPSVKSDVFSKDGKLVYKKGDLPSSFDIKQRYNDPSDFMTHKSYATSLNYSHKFSTKSRIDFKASYNHDEIDYFSTEELSYLTSENSIYNTYFMSGDKKKYICLDSLQRSYPLRFAHHNNTYQHYLDYTNSFDVAGMSNKFLVGLFTMNIDRTSFKGYDLGTDVKGDGLYGKLSVVNPVLNQGNISTSFSGASVYNEWVNALYFQDLISVADNLKLMLGARYDHFKMSSRSALVKRGHGLSDKSDWKSIVNNSFTYRLGAVYQPLEEMSLYASYSTFFKPRRTVYNDKYIYLDMNGDEFKPEDGGEVFKPETGYQMEVGVRYAINSHLNVAASTYYILKNDIVEYLGKNSQEKRVYGQVGTVESKGFELDVIWQPVDGLKANIGYSYNEARYKKFVDNKYMKSSNVDNFVSKCPNTQFFSWVYYDFNKGIFKNLNLGFGTNYRDSFYTNSSNTFELPSYWLMDASIGYSINKIYMKLKLNNIANKVHYTNTVYSNQYIPGYGRNALFTIGLNI